MQKILDIFEIFWRHNWSIQIFPIASIKISFTSWLVSLLIPSCTFPYVPWPSFRRISNLYKRKNKDIQILNILYLYMQRKWNINISNYYLFLSFLLWSFRRIPPACSMPPMMLITSSSFTTILMFCFGYEFIYEKKKIE